MTVDTFKPEATRAGNMEKAHSWLDKAIKLEADGKSTKMIEMALERACKYETAAFASPA